MLKTRVLIGLCALLVTDVLYAMQQQEQVQTQEQEQIQTQTKKKKKKDPQGNQNHSDDKADSIPAAPQTELQTQMAAIMNTIAQTYGSVDALVKAKMKDHVRMCPTCTRTSADCPCDQDRLRNGNIMPCICAFCKSHNRQL